MQSTKIQLPIIMLAALSLLGLGGCSVVRKAYAPNPEPHPVLPVTPAANPDPAALAHTDGSIWTAQSVNLFADDKALRRGDIVLVKVLQKNTGSKEGNTATSRKSSISGKIKYLFGAEDDINDLTNYSNVTQNPDGTQTVGEWDPNNLIEAEAQNGFEGDGKTKRSDSLQATVSAIVTDVLSNGNLVIYGHQTVTLNEEASVLTVQGIVRPSDIDAANTVDSSRIADANIEFTGSGVITDKQHPGLGTRLFDWLWPL